MSVQYRCGGGMVPFSLALAAAVAVAQPATRATEPLQARTAAPAPTGLIIGRVVEAGRGTPVSGVVVALSGPGIPARRVIVDPQGRFMFTELPAGAFAIAATKSGYLDGAFGKQRPDGTGHPLTLRDGEHVTDASLRMWRFATITGIVTDDADDPVLGATVQVFKRTVVAGHWRWTNTGLSGSTDQRGIYRVISLVPGEYTVVLTSMTSAIPASFLSLAAMARARDPESADLLRIAQTNGTNGYISDLMQGFPSTRVGDMLLQGGAGAPPSGDDRSVNVYPTVWSRSASSPAQATIVKLDAGDNRAGVDLRTTLTRTVRVSGQVIGPDGPVPYLALRLVSGALDDVAAEVTTSLSQSLVAAMTASRADGTFTFLVPPGQYVVRALTSPPRPPNLDPLQATTVLRTADGMSTGVAAGPPLPLMVTREPTLWAAVPVTVGETDMSGVTVLMRAGLRVTGRVEFEGVSPKPTGNELRAIRMFMDPADGRTAFLPTSYQAQVDPNGGVYTIGLIAGRYVLRVETAPRGWTLKAAMLAGRDISDTGVTLDRDDVDGLMLTFTDHPSTLAGTVRDVQHRPDESAAVLIFPSDGTWTNLGATARRLRSARPSRTGAFTITSLPPGDYDVVAIGEEFSTSWQAPEFLQRLARIASRVTIVDGQAAAIDLTTTPIR